MKKKGDLEKKIEIWKKSRDLEKKARYRKNVGILGKKQRSQAGEISKQKAENVEISGRKERFPIKFERGSSTPSYLYMNLYIRRNV